MSDERDSADDEFFLDEPPLDAAPEEWHDEWDQNASDAWEDMVDDDYEPDVDFDDFDWED